VIKEQLDQARHRYEHTEDKNVAPHTL